MIRNGLFLASNPPLFPFIEKKVKKNGVSYGLGEAGYDIRVKQEIVLSPKKRFTIASTVEEFFRPDDLVGIVHDKSTWARQGLSVFNTVIEPGWKGFLTLELVYHGAETLRIPADTGIAQVIFHELREPTQYSGKYQDQPDAPVGSIFE